MLTRDIRLTANALAVLDRRYLIKGADGKAAETPEGMFRRVAASVAEVDERYEKGSGKPREEVYFEMLSTLSFLPNSPTLMNAGTAVGQYSACFVIPVGDSIKEIFDAVSAMAFIHQSGGGTGFSFSRLRPKDDVVGPTGGVASGPVSFMRVFDQATEVIKQGGRRRGANMGILRVDHPDIVEFIRAKERPGEFRNFNLSVGVTDAFMEALAADGEYPLVNPRDGRAAGRLRARAVWELIAEAACGTGDPGVVFLDRINRTQPTPAAGEIEATNPCGEQPLLPYESCNLGSINLKAVVRDGALDWDALRRLVRDGVQFLDNIIDANRYPLPEIERMTRANRKVGLGVMGLAEALIMLGLPYASEEAVSAAEGLMRFISEEAVRKSSELGRTRGSFPNFRGSRWDEAGMGHMRNATVTTIAPTGTISIIAGASSGIEPLFAVSYVRKVLDGTELPETNALFVQAAKDRGFYSEGLMRDLARTGSVRGMAGVPNDVRRIYLTAFDIAPEWHVRMQAAFQRHTDNAVSKTINMPGDATPRDVEAVYSLAYRLGCKGITVFRYGSRGEQVLSVEGRPAMTSEEGLLKADAEYVGECKICSV